MIISIPENINIALNCLNKNGFNAFVVGGCVRDACLNKTPNDWDITTSATPDEMKQVFCDFRVIETGLRHGTLSVFVNGEIIEITTMRVDGEYTDNRHPDFVEFTTDIEKDLSRRDFTVNAMAYHPQIGLIDPFGGREDIEKRLIRCVGNADKRFNEDALRIMRALRFSSTLDFSIDNETRKSVLKNRNLLLNVANERIRVEFLKMLCGDGVKRILSEFYEVIFEIIPELRPMYNFPQNTRFHIFDVWEHTVNSVNSVIPDPTYRMTMLLHDLGKPSIHTVDSFAVSHFKGHQQVSCEIADKILKRLRFSNAERTEICKMILYHDWRPKGERKEILHLASECTPEFLLKLLPVLRADAMAQNPEYLQKKLTQLEKTEKVLSSAIENGLCLNVNSLAIDGNDLLALGFCGKEIKYVLENVLNLIIDNKLLNDKTNILTYIKKNYNIN